MSVIGSYGGVVFEITTKKILTYDEFTRELTPRWEAHDLLNNKPLPEFKGPGSDELSFRIKLRADLGVNPEKEINKLRTFANQGKTSLFIRGNKPVSTNPFIIKSIKETHSKIDNKGNVLSIEAEISIAEYPKIQVTTKKKTVKSTKSASSSKSSLKSTGKITIIVKSVHIRSGPSTSYKVLGYAFKGNTLTVYGTKNGWYYLGSGKYITGNSKYVKFKKG